MTWEIIMTEWHSHSLYFDVSLHLHNLVVPIGDLQELELGWRWMGTEICHATVPTAVQARLTTWANSDWWIHGVTVHEHDCDGYERPHRFMWDEPATWVEP